MNNLSEFTEGMDLFFDFIFLLLILFLAFTIKYKIAGRGWLKAYGILRLFNFLVAHYIYKILVQRADFLLNFGNQLDQLQNIPNIVYSFSVTCFLMFLFSNWCKYRIHFNSRNFLFSYKGRITRAAFWIGHLSILPIVSSISLAFLTTGDEGPLKIILWIISALVIIPAIWIYFAIYTKRWHDLGKSGWMSLVYLIPVIGSLYFIWKLGFIKGTKGANSYGEDPLEINKPEMQV